MKFTTGMHEIVPLKGVRWYPGAWLISIRDNANSGLHLVVCDWEEEARKIMKYSSLLLCPPTKASLTDWSPVSQVEGINTIPVYWVHQNFIKRLALANSEAVLLLHTKTLSDTLWKSLLSVSGLVIWEKVTVWFRRMACITTDLKPFIKILPWEPLHMLLLQPSHSYPPVVCWQICGVSAPISQQLVPQFYPMEPEERQAKGWREQQDQGQGTFQDRQLSQAEALNHLCCPI